MHDAMTDTFSLNELKAGPVVKHYDNRSKDNCIPVQLAQKSQRFCRILALQAKDAQGQRSAQ